MNTKQTPGSIKLELGNNFIRSYQRLAYTPWHALAEFVDNSTQSFANNEAKLRDVAEKGAPPLEVSIVYDRNKDFIRISDNAMGMALDELQMALHLGHPPTIATGRSQFGMGLKTAAFWLGSQWTITTKKLHETVEHRVTVEMDRVAGGDLNLPHSTTENRPGNLHYTIVEVKKLHRKFVGRRLGLIKDFLRSMYRQDFRDGTLRLEWAGVPLSWDEKIEYATGAEGEYRKDFAFDINGKLVEGEVGILAKGSRAMAGFSILHRGRVVRGWPDSWRPEAIYGQLQGSNDLVNQRITGELYVRDFDVSHTKDNILWTEDEEDKLADLAKDFIQAAKNLRFRRRDDLPGPTDAELQVAVDEIRNEMTSPEFIDQLNVTPVPPPELAVQVTRPLIDAGAAAEPIIEANLDLGDGTKLRFELVISADASPNDPYFVSDTANASKVLVVVNRRHPHWAQLAGSVGAANFLRHCLYDAVAEWKCRRAKVKLEPNTLLLIKDDLLRVADLIQMSPTE